MSAVLGFKIISLQPTPILRNKVSWPAAASMTARSMIRMNRLTANDAATAAPPSTHVCIQSGPHLNARQRPRRLDAARMVPARASRGGHLLSLLRGQRGLPSPAVVDAMNVGLPFATDNRTPSRRKTTWQRARRRRDAYPCASALRTSHSDASPAKVVFTNDFAKKGKVMPCKLGF